MVEETIVDVADETIGQVAVCHTREVGVADNNVAKSMLLATTRPSKRTGPFRISPLISPDPRRLPKKPAFYLDVNPTLDTDEPAERFIFDTITSAPIGEQSSSESEEEEIVLVPRKHVQPEPIHLPEEPSMFAQRRAKASSRRI